MRYHHSSRRTLECLEPRRFLAAVPFLVGSEIVSNELFDPRQVELADLDADGHQDLVILNGDQQIVWKAKLDRQGTFSPVQVIGRIANNYDFAIADMDGDGDSDVAAKSAWIENMNGQGTKWTTHSFPSASPYTLDVLAVDMDGDGDNDIVNSGEWFENQDGQGSFGAPRDLGYTGSIAASDIDADGDNDLMIGTNNSVQWIENVDGFKTIENRRPIGDLPGSNLHGAWGFWDIEVTAGDVDGDGDLDAVASQWYLGDTDTASGGALRWFENTNGRGQFGPAVTIDDNSIIPRQSVRIVDLDNDGDQDIVSGIKVQSGFGGFLWNENIDGNETFQMHPPFEINSDARWITVGKVNDDELIDIVLSSESRDAILWSANLGQGVFSLLAPLSILGAEIFQPADMDADGDVDVLAASNRSKSIYWLENVGQANTYRRYPILAPGADYIGDVQAADVDLDGDQDLLWTAFDGLRLQLQTDGVQFGAPIVIDTGADSFQLADWDHDDDLDLIVDDRNTFTMSILENTGRGTGEFRLRRVFDDNRPDRKSILTADVDGDGDLDIVSPVYQPAQYGWYENLDGRGTFSSQPVIIQQNERYQVAYDAADLDRDGDVDLIIPYGHWFENNGSGRFSAPQPMNIDRPPNGSMTITQVADFDRDGDPDLLAQLEYFHPPTFVTGWFENLDGRGTFGSWRVIDNAHDRLTKLVAYDMDADEDLDVLAGSASHGNIIWYANALESDLNGDRRFDALDIDRLFAAIASGTVDRQFDLDDNGFVNELDVRHLVGRVFRTSFGDANLDGQFDSADLVKIFQASLYEDRVENNSTWATGDWNGDGVFDSADLVLAFQDGDYRS